MRSELTLGKDFEVVSEKMWFLLCKAHPKKSPKPNCLKRSYERIGMGMRTQLEYFYQEFKFEFKSLDPDFPLSANKICYSSLRSIDSLKTRVL